MLSLRLFEFILSEPCFDTNLEISFSVRMLRVDGLLSQILVFSQHEDDVKTYHVEFLPCLFNQGLTKALTVWPDLKHYPIAFPFVAYPSSSSSGGGCL
jgi:hypothetical protein